MSEEIISRNSIVAGTPDWQEGFDQGVLQTQIKVCELLDEVIEAYGSLYETDIHSYNKQQVNAVQFMKGWVISGGQTDLDGNRACYPW